jgi:AraC family transcriptional regulator
MKMKTISKSSYGETLRSREVAGLVLMETVYAPGLKIPRHSHDHSCFCFVLQGGFTEIYEQRTRSCTPLTLTFHPSDEMHSEHFDNSGGRLFSIVVEPQWLERVREYPVVLDDSADFHGDLTAWLTKRLYHEFQQMDEVSPLAIEGLALEMLAEASRRHRIVSERKPLRWLEQARDLLHAQFSEPLALADIAESVGVHPVHLARVFRQRYRCTVGEYVHQLRIEFTCRELSRSTIPLAEIGLLAGFSSQSHFSTTFKRLTGMTPAQYRSVSRSR